MTHPAPKLRVGVGDREGALWVRRGTSRRHPRRTGGGRGLQTRTLRWANWEQTAYPNLLFLESPTFSHVPGA